MKKIFFFAAALSALSFASCKKDRTCTCVTTYPGGGADTEIKTFTKSKKSDARANCLSTTTTVNGYAYTQTCSLK